MTNPKLHAGMTVIELAIIPLILALTLSILRMGMRKIDQLLSEVEQQDEREGLKNYVAKNFSCDETTSTSRETCERGGYIDIYSSACSALQTGGEVGVRLFHRFRMRTHCSRLGGEYEVRFEYSPLSSSRWVTLDIDPRRCRAEKTYLLSTKHSQSALRQAILGNSPSKKELSPNLLCRTLGFDYGLFQYKGKEHPTRFTQRNVYCGSKSHKTCR